MKSMQLTAISTLILGTVALGGFLSYKIATNNGRGAPADVSGTTQQAKLSVPPIPRTLKQDGKPARLPAQEDAVRLFRERLGSDLKLEFHDNGKLSSVRGAPGAGVLAGPDYRSDDPQKAIARAKEILEIARDLLGVQNEFPLENAVANATAASAQVRFQETLGGVPMAPIGDLSIDLGPKGELLGLDSSYVQDVHPLNDLRVSSDQARSSAIDALPESEREGAHPDAGSLVIWVLSPQGDSGHPTSRYAYRYAVDGRQIVIDAGDGSVILRRDRRSF